jgi:hypothetical protein
MKCSVTTWMHRPSPSPGAQRPDESAQARSTDHPDLPPCAGCGRCCHLVVELRPGDDVPEEFVVDRGGTRCMDQHGDGACIALDPATRLCTLYERRPQTCRDIQRGENLCRQILATGGLSC